MRWWWGRGEEGERGEYLIKAGTSWRLHLAGGH